MKTNRFFEIYPRQSKATNMSIFSGGLKLMTILMILPAVLITIVLIVLGVQTYMTFGMLNVIFLLFEEGEELIPLLFVLWGGAAVFGYFAHALKVKAAQLGSENNSEVITVAEDK